MTHPFDLLYRMDEAEEDGRVPISRELYLHNDEHFQSLLAGNFIALVDSGRLDQYANYAITSKGKDALKNPDAFFFNLDEAELYHGQGDDSMIFNKYFKNVHTGSLVNCRSDAAYMYKYSEGWRELTEEQYLDEVNFASNDASERDRLEDVSYEANDFFVDESMEEPHGSSELPTPASSWLAEALAITTSDRRRDYGHPLPNFLRICLKWSVTLQIAVTPLQVAQMMLDMKTARDQNAYKADNWVDSIGYSNTVQMMDERMRDMGYTDGIKTFQMFEGDNKVGWMYRLLQQHEAKYEQGT